MGDVHRLTKAGLRQFEVDQQDPVFLDWLAGMDAALDRFLTEDAPQVGALHEPWSAEGLRLAASRERLIFADPNSALLPENADMMDRFARFIGEVFVRNFDGSWYNVPGNGPDDVQFWPVVGGYATLGYVEPVAQARAAIAEGRVKRAPTWPEGVLVWMFGNMRRDHEAWMSAGRPSVDEWQQSYYGL